ncbi:MAG: hypothetical protein FP824_10980 [Euryarchaeota archaeon]|nr:hypothetical protein [Euryarchaeota archaeon]
MGEIEIIRTRYAITYFDPLDEEGMRVRTWVFDSLEGAEGWRGELGAVWRTARDESDILYGFDAKFR